MPKKRSETPKKPVVRTIHTVPGNDVPTYYVNNASLSITNWDVRFTLGQIQQATNTTVEVKDVAYLFMSHAHAKAFSLALVTTMEKLDAMLKQAKESAEASAE
jgi:hypothetical protein